VLILHKSYLSNRNSKYKVFYMKVYQKKNLNMIFIYLFASCII
jgi:hypothetical protein